MLSKRTKKVIVFGFWGGITGFVVALLLFVPSCALAFKAGWSLPIYPLQILIGGTIVAFFILILSIILNLKRFGTISSTVFFLISYIMTLQISKKAELPIEAREMPLLWIAIWVTIFLVWGMFIIAGIKKGTSQTDKK